jgi:hypothetical protein
MNRFVLCSLLCGLAVVGGNARASVPVRDGIIVKPIPIPRPRPIPFPLCPTTLNESKKYSWDKGPASVAGITWNGGLDGAIGVDADCDKLEAYASGGVHFGAFGITAKALDVKVSASTKIDHTNSIDLGVYAFGFELKKINLAQSSAPLSAGYDLGYILPSGAPYDGSWTYAPDWADGGMASFSYNTVADVAADLYYEISPTVVKVVTLSSANLNASVNASVGYHDVTLSQSANLSIGRLTQGGHATLKQDAGTAWKADVANSVSLNNVMGIDLSIDVPFVGKKSLFNMPPKEWWDDYTFTKNFMNAF